MIPRYSNPEMEHIWTDQNKLDTWLKIEILVCEANEKLGVIPKGVTKEIKKRADFDQNRILELERITKHDVIAFLTNVAEYVGENAKYIHNGLTSSDILDTRKTRLTLGDINKMRLASEAHDAQQKEEAVFTQKMYGQPAQTDDLAV